MVDTTSELTFSNRMATPRGYNEASRNVLLPRLPLQDLLTGAMPQVSVFLQDWKRC
jgi:hypothetical protein